MGNTAPSYCVCRLRLVRLISIRRQEGAGSASTLSAPLREEKERSILSDGPDLLPLVKRYVTGYGALQQSGAGSLVRLTVTRS